MEFGSSKSPSLVSILIKILIVVIIYDAAQVAAAYFFFDRSSLQFLLILIASQFLFFLAPTAYIVNLEKNSISDTFRLKSQVPIASYAWAVLGLIGLEMFTSGFVSVQIAIMPDFISDFVKASYHGYVNKFIKIMGSPSPLNIALSVIALALTPAICEELIFRGYLQKSLERIISARSSIVISSVIFAAIHFNIELFVPLFVAGGLLGYFANVTGSIYPSILIHFLLNASSVLMYHFNKESVLELTTKQSVPTLSAIGYLLTLLIGSFLIIFSILRLMKSQAIEPSKTL